MLSRHKSARAFSPASCIIAKPISLSGVTVDERSRIDFAPVVGLCPLLYGTPGFVHFTHFVLAHMALMGYKGTFQGNSGYGKHGALPRGPRLDAPGVLHPVMVRGTEEAKRRDLSRFLTFSYDPFGTIIRVTL